MALSDSFSHSGILNVEHVFQLWWNRTKYQHFSWINCIFKWCSLKRAASSLFWPHVMVVVVVLCFITTRDSFKGLCEHFFWQKSVALHSGALRWSTSEKLRDYNYGVATQKLRSTPFLWTAAYLIWNNWKKKNCYVETGPNITHFK